MELVKIDYSTFEGEGESSNFMQTVLQHYMRDLVKKIDDLVFSKIKEKGFPTDLDFLKENLEKHIYEDQPEWDHYFIKGERIISIEKPKFGEDPFDTNFKTTFNYF